MQKKMLYLKNYMIKKKEKHLLVRSLIIFLIILIKKVYLN